MFHVHGIHGHVFSGTLEQLRQQHLVAGINSVRRVAPVGASSGAVPPQASPATGRGAADKVGLAYGSAAARGVRQPLSCAADVMHSPALTVPAEATLGEAWQMLARWGIGQAPVLGSGGVLIGLVGRAELMLAASLDSPGAAPLSARLSQPVTAVMWSPVPSTSPATELRRVAALLLHTGLPGVPVTGDQGELIGFVSRTDLLRALVADPPLDLWG